MRNLQWPELLLIALVVVLLFGARKLPEAAKGMGQALKIFKKEVKEEPAPEQPTVTTTSTTPEPPRAIQQAQQPVPPTTVTAPQETEHTER